MNRIKFTELFRKITVMSLKQYCLRDVMAYASMMMDIMIESGEFKIKDIARQCEYSNLRNFLYSPRKKNKFLW